MSTANFLLEIGTCELPPQELSVLARALMVNFKIALEEAKLSYDTLKTFYTPRRLALLVEHLILETPKCKVEVKGPSVKAGMIDGYPTNAVINFASNYQITVDQLVKRDTPKGEYFFYTNVVDGIKTEKLLPQIIQNSVTKLPLKKAMFWGEGKGPFVRPVRWLVALLNEQVIPVELFAVVASNYTFGHRFLSKYSITLSNPLVYEQQMQEAFVIVDYDQRRKMIEEGLKKLEHVKIDEALLDEVTNLVEYPVILEGKFDERFLKLPTEVITTTLKVNQKCFIEVDANGAIMAKFAIVSNLLSKNLQTIIEGNEKVVKARLTDAEYFYNEDRKIAFTNRIESLSQRVFQQNLGTLADKAARVEQLLNDLLPEVDKQTRKMAAWLAKCDLSTLLVGEFPELQGVIGYYLYRQENLLVAEAIKEHYLPRFAEDVLPQKDLSIALAIADRVDTLVGTFLLGKKPTGDKDPLGIRRIALAIIRLIFHWQRPLDVKRLLKQSLTYYQRNVDDGFIEEIILFLANRLMGLYSNYNVNFFKTVIHGEWNDLLDFDKAIRALAKCIDLTWLTSYKRLASLLVKSHSMVEKVDAKLLQTASEIRLLEVLNTLTPLLEKAWQAKLYRDYLESLMQFSEPLDDFFANTMVLVSNTALQNNRLALLQQILNFFKRYGSFEYLVV